MTALEIIFILFLVLFTIIIIWLRKRAEKYDPLYGCRLYEETGCAHIDGYLCDFPKCDMLKDYLDTNTYATNNRHSSEDSEG